MKGTWTPIATAALFSTIFVLLSFATNAAHANPINPDDYATVFARSDALRTLASRALLAVLKQIPLGYVDYGSSGLDAFPIRRWSDRQQLRALPDARRT